MAGEVGTIRQLDDTLRTKKALKEVGMFEMPSYGMTDFPDEPLFRGIESFQKRHGLKQDGIMKPDGETATKLGQVLGEKNRQIAKPTSLFDAVEPSAGERKLFTTSISLNGPVRPSSNVSLVDAGKVKSVLHGLGLLKADVYGLDAYPDHAMFDAIKAFQRQKGLRVDGEMQPGGETETALNRVLGSAAEVEEPNKKNEEQVEVAFLPAVPIGIAFAEWLIPILAVATAAAARAAFSTLSRPHQQELRKQYREETGNEDDEDDVFFRRWQAEDRRYDYRGPEWINGRRERAAYRRALCDNNGGKPHPQEPPEWSAADEVVSFNPR